MDAKEFIQSELLAEYSLAQTKRLAHWIGTDPDHMEALWHLFTGNDYRICQRAAWVVGHLDKQQAGFVLARLPELLDCLQKNDVRDAVKRNAVRLLQFAEIPEPYLGRTADVCFNLLADPQEAIAIRVFSMSVLANICQKVPELWPELAEIVQLDYANNSAAFKSRARKLVPPAGYPKLQF